MTDAIKALAKQPYWVLLLIVGSILVVLPCLNIDKDHNFTTHPPSTIIPVIIGGVLLAVGLFGFGMTIWRNRSIDSAGVDFTKVSEKDGVFSTKVSDCEIRVCEGRIEAFQIEQGVAVALPCNEYFDDRCAGDTRSALGAYVSRFFSEEIEQFISLLKSSAHEELGPGILRRKTEKEEALSFGSGHCLLLQKPLGRPDPIALISTTTQRAGEGLRAEISCLFQGMHELDRCLADARINEVVMPLLGGGHGGIDPPLAFIGLLLAVAEAARYGQRLKRVTIVVFKRDASTSAVVDRMIVRKTLALVGMQN